VPRDAPYRLADGSAYLVGDKALEPVLTRLNALFARENPDVRFTMLLRESPVGIDGIIAGVSVFAPIAHDAWESEIDPFKRLHGYRPLDIRIARVGHAASGRENPPGVYVNAANPLRRLTIDEVGRIFTTGQLPSDLRHWSQLGVGGEWAKHAIHVYGTRDDGETVTALRIARFGGRPFARHYEALSTDADVLEALIGDRYGIGLAWRVDARRVPAGVRWVALSSEAGSAPSQGGYGDVRQGLYPLSPFAHIYVNAPPGQPLDPVARAYLRLALSAAGQQIIESQKEGAAGFVPLTAEEIAQERAKIR
jgi:phosphate transport system substrate-binding protein